MPFGRSHARSKSRSPAIGSSTMALPQPSRPPTFLPPSHYAAAAGLTYPRPSREPVKDDRSLPSYPTQSSAEEAPGVESSESHTSQSSTMGRLMRRVSSKRFTVSLSRSESRSEREKDLTEQRKSQLVDIPLLETQLLPSLKDTVDRMTQSPQPRPDHGDSADTESTFRSATSRRRHEDAKPKLSPSMSSLPPPFNQTPRSTGEASAVTAIPRFVPAPSPRPKSALKSPVRRKAPAPSVSNLPQPQPHPTHGKVDQSDSFGIIHSGSETNSDLSSPPNRLRPGKLPVPSSSIPTPKPSTALQKLRTKTKPKSNPGTPQQNPRNSVFATPQPSRAHTSQLPQSSLPRPKVTRFKNIPVSDSGSELEREVDRTLSPGRLVVTNAIVIPSSSESEDSMSTRRRSQWGSRRGHHALPPPADRTPRSALRQASNVPIPHATMEPTPRTRNCASVGLGLNLNGVEVGDRRMKRSSSSDEEGVYDKFSDGSLMDEPVLFPASEDDDGSIYEDDLTPDFKGRNRCSMHQVDHVDTRREEALMGLVDGFHRDYRRSTGTNPRLSMAHSSSGADCNVQGLAISDSTEMRVGQTERAGAESRDLLHGQEGWDADSAYSGDDDRETKPLDKATRSLRHTSTRNSWKRPSSAVAVRESIYLEQQRGQPSGTLMDGGRARSVSPIAASAPHSKSPTPAVRSPRPLSPLPAAVSPGSRTSDSRSPGNHKNRLSQRISVSARRNSRGIKSPSSSSTGSNPCSPPVKSPPAVSSPSEASSLSPRQHVEAKLRDERLAFGIPDSLSFCGSNTTPDEDDSIRPPWSRMNSTTSTGSKRSLQRADSGASESGWKHHHHKFSKELSRGAAALFETLTSKVARSNSRKLRSPRHQRDDEREQDRTPVMEPNAWTTRDSLARSPRSSPAPASGRGTGAFAVQSPPQGSLESAALPSCSTLGSVYEEPPLPSLPAIPEHTPPASISAQNGPHLWTSTLSPGVYDTLYKQYGPMEMERQEVIYELFNFDREFVKSARHVIRNYFLPLRTRDSRAWLPGLPLDIARLFDWLEDIVNLHAAIARAIAPLIVAWKGGAIVERIAGTLRGFVPQLEIYMPYLVKLEIAKELVSWYVEMDLSEFGEYLRLKAGEAADGEWGLERMVREPSSRLDKYTEFFQRLCDTTPRKHPDYLTTISLLHATRTAVRVMGEVKLREDEYDFVKDLATRIDGLSNTVPLARRARRLLWYGTLFYPAPFVSPPVDANGVRSPKSSKLTRSPAQRGQKLATAVRDWDKRRIQRGSISSSPSSSPSVQTLDITSSASSASELVTSRWDPRLQGFGLLGRPGLRPRDAPKKPSEELRQILSGNRIGDDQERTRNRVLKVMVFTDVIVLTSALPVDIRARSDEGGMDRCRLLEGLGLSRLLDFSENDGGLNLNLVPIQPEQLDTGLISDDTHVTPIALSFPPAAIDGERQQVLSALRKCQHHTFRSLSMPTLPGTLMEDLEIDTRQSLVGILSSGLPLPKSPSIQFQEAQRGLRRDVADGEREERGWWTLRFHQVLRELQREDSSLLSMVPSASGPSVA